MTHGRVSVAKKDVRHTSVLYTGTTKLSFSTFCISTTTGPIVTNLFILCLSYTQLCVLFVKKICSVVGKIFVPENCPTFFTFFFFFALVQKANFEPTKDNLLMNPFPSNLVCMPKRHVMVILH